MKKTLNFVNLTEFTRTQIVYGTLPFKKGEWGGETLTGFDGNQSIESIVVPFGKRYDDGSCRYGAAISKVKLEGWQSKSLQFRAPTDDVNLPRFKFSKGMMGFASSMLFIRFTDGDTNEQYDHQMSNWTVIEDGPMRKVFQSRERIGGTSDLVCDFKLYIMSDQDLAKFEMRITGSNPDNTRHRYLVRDLLFGIDGNGYINIQGRRRRGAVEIDPYKHFRLLDDGYFGDGQSLSYTGELLLPNFDDEDYMQTAYAEMLSPLWGMSPDWADCPEAYSLFGLIPTPPSLPDNGDEFMKDWFLRAYKYMNSDAQHPWEDYYMGNAASAGQAGAQRDFGLIEGWETLYTGRPEMIEAYYFLAQEDIKRPGHYLENDGSWVTHKNHPQWIVWDGTTHYHTSVSTDRLGKTIAGPRPNNGLRGKPWSHMSNNLLHLASILTCSYMLADECNHFVELWLAGRTTEKDYPGWSTNGLGAGRDWGRPTTSMLHHDLFLDRPEIIERALDLFNYNVTPKWHGGKVSGPVKLWQIIGPDGRMLADRSSWSGWNETLGWIGMAALYIATGDNGVRQHMIDWGHSILNYGWGPLEDSPLFPTQRQKIGYAIEVLEDGQPLTQEQYNDPASYRSGGTVTIWGLPLLIYIKDSELFSQEDRVLAQRIYDKLMNERMTGQIYGDPYKAYDHLENPFDEVGRWTAITP